MLSTQVTLPNTAMSQIWGKSLHLVNKSLQVIAFNFSPHKLDLCLAYTNNFKFLSHCYAAHATFPQDE